MKKTDVDQYFVGGEPRFDGNISINSALSWYANQMDSKDSKKYTVEHVKHNGYPKESIEAITNAPENLFLNLGFVCRIKKNGANLTEKNEIWINNRIKSIIEQSKSPTISEFAVKKVEISPHDRIFDQSSTFISDIEDHVDGFVKNKKVKFDVYEYLTKKDAKGPHAKHILNHFTPLFNELVEVLAKTDEQLNESYSKYTKNEVKVFHGFVESIITACNHIITNAKITRKPRKTKKVSVTKLVSKLKYKQSDNDLKLTSVNPLDILSAKTLVVYNTKYRTFGMYVAQSGGTLSVKGTTIINFDDILSTQKKLRKPEEQLKGIKDIKKLELNKFYKEIKCKDSTLTGRINEETILLKVFK